MEGKPDKNIGFAELELNQLPRSRSFVYKLEGLIDWKPFKRLLRRLYSSKMGRPSYPPLMMLKILLLQQWYSMSDPETEDALLNRIDFRRFVGLTLTATTPDYSTISRFRTRLMESGLQDKLLGLFEVQLAGHNLEIRRVSLIDATIVQSAAAPKKGGNPADPDAKWIKKRNKAHFGYKVHATTDAGDGFIRRVEVTPANTHDSKLFETVIPKNSRAVFADKAYAKAERKRHLREQGIYCGILDKSSRNRSLGLRQNRRNRRKSAVRQAVERLFGTLKRCYGLVRMRYFSLERNRAHLKVVALAFNIRKLCYLRA